MVLHRSRTPGPQGHPRSIRGTGVKEECEMDKENLELAEEHIKIAEELVVKEAADSDGEEKKGLTDAAFSLEKAEADLEGND